MEPQGPPLSPGTSHGSDSRPLDLAQDLATPTSPNCTLQPSYSPSVSDGLMSGKDSGNVEDESSKQVQASQSTAGADRRAHRRFSSSAFASSLSWDSDSEREALDEEDLQHFSNPHGLAAHSPGSPSSGHRHESEEAQNPEKVQCLHINTESLVPLEATSADNENAKTQEPNTSQADSTELPEDKVWNVSEEAKTFLAKIKPKDGCQMEEGPDASESVKQLERDVYSFPGDSDPESPPDSSPWARSTSSSQRCRKSRVLLRPFCGLGSSAQTAEAECQATSKPTESAVRSEDQGSCEFESLREGAAEEAEDDGQSEQEAEREIFTCVECSIYFKKQSHLQEHIMEHCESSAEGGETSVRGGSYRCVECGWGLPNQPALEEHLRRHQESRLKILQEIKKLNASGRAGEQRSISGLETAVALDGSAALTSEKEAEHSFDAPPSLSPARGSSEGAESMATDSDKASGSVRCPAQVRGGASNRRRFWCTKCTFTTRTSQALANHAKTHNRKKNVLPKNESNSPRSPSSSRSTSASLACFHCAFRTSSQALMREHQKLLHPGHFFISGWPANEIGPPSKSRLSKPNRDSELPCGSGSGSVSRSKTTLDQRQHGAPACEESGIPDCVTALPVGQVFKSSPSRKFSVRRKSWSRLDKDNLLGILEHHEVLSPELDSESSQKEAESPVGPEAGPHETADDWPEEESAKSLLTPKRTVDNKDKSTSSKKDRKVFFLRSRNRSAAGAVELDGDDNDDDADEDDLQHFLTESLLDGDAEDAQDDAEAFKSMEKKCPYCPDRFHNGIGLANHVRGHLNRVGVSYNVRHFISPKEVNEIERKFSYQKKKKKVANFDPGTFSVMHCEFCSAGFDTRAGLSSHARAHLRDFGITNWDITISPINILRELFSSRPDLQLPAAPPRSPGSSVEEEGEEEEEEEEKTESELRRRVKEVVGLELEGEPCQEWAPGAPSSPSSPEHSSDHCVKQECEARHLKCEGNASSPFGEPCGVQSTLPPLPAKDEYLEEDMDVDRKPSPIPPTLLALSSPSTSPGASPTATTPPHPGSPLSVVRKAPISSLLPVSSPLRSQEHKVGLVKGSAPNHSQAPGAIATSKPLWAPQENDAPLNLTLEVDPNKDIVCQLCGAWFETRKGLSSHARAHLRHFGVEYSESKGSPIDLLDQLVSTDDFKHKASEMLSDGHLQLQQQQQLSPSLLNLSKASCSSPSPASLIYTVTKAASKATSSTTTSSGLGPPPKRHKSSSMRVFRLSSGELMALHNEPPKEIGCEFCGEYFENRKGLSSHARSHLRQMGITEWSVNGSPIDTLREVITRRGLPCALPRKPLKSPPPSSPGPPPRSPLPASSSSSPSSALLGRPPFAFVHPSSPPPPAPPPTQLASSKSSSAPLASSGGGLILKLKPEPAQLEVTAPGTVGRAEEFPGDTISWANADSIFPLNLAIAHEPEPTRDIRCEFCGEYFENRKGLSSHARSHLRQMGITEWSVNGSPIDTLREVMHKRGLEPSSDQGVKKESSQDPGSPSWEGAGEPGGVEGGGVAGFQTSKFSKVPLGLLQSGSRIHKQGLTSLTAHAVSSAGRFFRISPLGKRPQQFDEVRSRGSERSPPPRQQPRTFSPQLHDFSFKRKASPDKHGHRDPSCELCGFFFENRKALASHARAHLRQFGVTEWSVNGSPIETLSAWMRSRPQKVLEMHRSYMQGNRSSLKKKDSPSTLSTTSSSSSSSSRWSSSLALSLVRPHSRALIHGSSSSKSGQGDTGTHLASPPAKPRCRSPSLSRLVVAAGGGGGAGGRGGGGGGGDGHLPLQAQVARSELNVRLPRGFERRPLKHPSCPDGAERDSGPPKPARTGTIPALVPKPPAAPLVKLVGKFYTLKCRFCEVQFHGPLSVQEDWIRHLQQHILKMNFSKAAAPPPPGAEDPAPSGEGAAQASTSTSSSVPAAAAAVPSAPCSSPSAPAERPLSAKVSEASPAAVALCTQTL